MARRIGFVLLAALFGAALLAPWIAPHSYEEQFRESPGAPPSTQFPLGTDDLGRDRLSRLIWGLRTSILLAPVAALISTVIAAAAGLAAGYRTGWTARAATLAIDLFLSLPWLFLLLAARAMIPLDTGPSASVTITFALLAALGWAGSARVLRGSARSIRDAEYLTAARAQGLSGWRILCAHLIPALRPLAVTQFWLLAPLFIVSEANLSMLGLGVAEPLPSLGTLMKELENYTAVPEQPGMLAPVAVLALVLGSLQLALVKQEFPK
jgi:ABC-type dipeptide/oligopeptide/nickel transport system permease subunit